MKLYAMYSPYNERLKDEWFVPSMTGEVDLHIHKAKSYGGKYKTDNFKEVVLEKADMILGAIQENYGDCFVYSDVDVQFFKPVGDLLAEAIEGFDIVCQRDEPGKFAPLCTGFFVIRANKSAMQLWRKTRNAIETEGRDQLAFNRIMRQSTSWVRRIYHGLPHIKYDYLPNIFFSGGTLTGKAWEPGMELPIPKDIVLHHANWTVGIENKIAQLEYVRKVVSSRCSGSS